MKKILLVSPIPPPNGGIATWTKQYITYFENDPMYEVYLVNTAIQGKRLETNKRNLLDEYKRYRKVKKAILSIIEETPIDIIHYNSSCTLLGLIKDFFTLRTIRNKKIIYHCRCDLCNYINRRLSHVLFKKNVSFSYKVFVLNTQSATFVKQNTMAKVELVSNYIAINNFFINRSKEFEKTRTFIYTGRISKEKGCDTILKLAPYFPDWKFELIGDANFDVDMSSCPPNVFLLGNMGHEEVLEKLKENVIFLFLSRTEGFSNSIVEAMISGLPVITTNVGANREMIEETGGIIINTDSLESCVVNIKQFIENKMELKKASLFNIDKVVQKYNIDYVINDMIDKYFH